VVKFGLISRIALLVVFVEVAAFSVLGWFYIDQFSTAAEEHIRTRLHLVGRMIADEDLTVSSLARKSLVSDLVGAPCLDGMVVGGNGRVIVSTNPSYLGRLTSSVPGFDARWIADSAPDEQFIAGEGTLTGVMHIHSASSSSAIYYTAITVSTAELNARKRSIALWGQAGSALFILLSSAAIVLIAQRLITRRVDASLAVLKEVENGALDARIPVSSDDELGQLQHGINSMTEKVGALLNQHRRNEEEIRATSQLLDSIIDNIPNMIFLKRASDLRFVLLNKAGEQLLGFDRQDMLGKNDHDLFPKEQADFFTANDREVLHSSTVRDIPEETIATRDGEQHILHTKKLALYDSRGEAEYLLGISEDITERKKTEETIRQLNLSLENRVQEEVAKNREKDHILIQQSRLAAMGEMIHNIAHQWRQPLNALTLLLANIKDAYDFNDMTEEYLDNEVRAGQQLIQRMSTTIDDFRDFFRPDRASGEFDMSQSAEDALFVMEAALKNNNIEVEKNLPKGLMAYGYSNQFAQVILNLLANAKEAIQHRKAAGGRIKISLNQFGDQGILAIEDNGGGIPEHVLPKIFDPYFTTKDKGSGIGLYMSKMITERNLNGKIEAANAEQGALFSIRLPLLNKGTLG
jgi:PAS domain S-box-containing protein